MTRKKLTLAEFAAQQQLSSRRCWLCGIPEKGEIEESRVAGVTQTTIVRWLQEYCGYAGEATKYKVASHFRHVDRQAATAGV